MARQFKPGQLQTGSLYNISSSYAVTASYALNGGGTGTTIDTGSFATTGSNIFKGSQTISGSNGKLVYTGTTPGAIPTLAEVHAYNDLPWLERFYNDTFSTTSASVVSNMPAIEAAFSSAERVTFTGSITPCATRSPYSPVAALMPWP